MSDDCFIEITGHVDADFKICIPRPKPQPITRSGAVKFTGDVMQTNNLVFDNIGKTSQATDIPLLADGITNSGGTVSNVAYNFNDPVAIVVLNPDGLTATVTSMASGGPASGNTTYTVTDSNGAVSQWNIPFTITVNKLPDQITQGGAVQFSDPV